MKKEIKFPKSHFFTYDDLPLLQVSHTWIQSSIWLEKGMENRIATFDLFVRDMPANRNYLIFGGLEEMIEWIKKIKFNKEEIDFLVRKHLASKKLAKYLRNFKFTGSIYALLEGTPFFPMEPVVRVTAPIIEASLIEYFLLTALTSNTGFFSKAARIFSVAKGNFEVAMGPLRGRSFESGIKASRAGYIYNIKSNAIPCVYRKYGIKTPERYLVNAQHLFIKSFPNELAAFRAIAEYDPSNCSFMIDTYDIETGLDNAIIVGKELKNKDFILKHVQIDSGDIFKQTKMIRKRLDEAGLLETGTIVSTNLDEYKLKKLVNEKVPCTIVAVATEYVNITDSPRIEAVYKLAETRSGNNIRYAAKLSKGKVSYPGRKQIFRKFKNGKMVKDFIGLENEKLGEPLLKPFIKNGKVIARLPDLEEIKKYAMEQLETLPEELKDLDRQHLYPVEPSGKLIKLLEGVRELHCKKEN